MGKAAGGVGLGRESGIRNSVLNMSCLRCLLEMLSKVLLLQIYISKKKVWW